jgi:hypothetical protein
MQGLAAGKKLTPALRAAEFCDLKIVAKSTSVRPFAFFHGGVRAVA